LLFYLQALFVNGIQGEIQEENAPLFARLHFHSGKSETTDEHRL